MSQDVDQGQRDQYLSFELAGAEYGIGILGVREILQYENITPVPSVPRSVRGVINLRGSVVPVIDLAVKFGMPDTQVTRLTCILIVEVKLDGRPAIMGLLADSVLEVIELGPADVEPPPSFGTRVKVDYLRGMGKVGAKRFVLLLDVDRVVSADERDVAIRAAELAASTPEAPRAGAAGG